MRPIEVNKSLDKRRAEMPFPVLSAHQPEFMPWLGNLSKAAMGDVYFVLDNVQYCKELFQNRNKIRIKSNEGWQWLTIPILGAKKKLMNWQDVKIDNSKNWKRKHLNSIRMSYSKSKHFSEIYPEIESLYENFDGDKLIDFLMLVMKYAHKKFDISIPVYRVSEVMEMGHDITGQKSDLIINMCKSVNAKSFIFGVLGRDYVETDKFDKNDIQIAFQNFQHPKYDQMHGDFVSHMSFIDLLFNYGKDSIDILNKSKFDNE
jgi:hypothetical protein